MLGDLVAGIYLRRDEKTWAETPRVDSPLRSQTTWSCSYSFWRSSGTSIARYDPVEPAVHTQQ